MNINTVRHYIYTYIHGNMNMKKQSAITSVYERRNETLLTQERNRHERKYNENVSSSFFFVNPIKQIDEFLVVR